MARTGPVADAVIRCKSTEVQASVRRGGVVRTGGEMLYRERTFFGVHEVTSLQDGDWHVLTHGTTTHGVQAFRGKVRVLPSAYYHPSGPIGDVVFTLAPDGRLRDVGASSRTPAILSDRRLYERAGRAGRMTR